MDINQLYTLQELASTGKSEAIIRLIDFYKENGDYQKAFLTAQRFEYFSSGIGYKVLAEFYFKGIGTEIDIDKAKEYYQKSFDLGEYSSGYQLAIIAIKEENYSSAINYLTYGMADNHIPSIKLLAKMYASGEGVIKNSEIAINLIKKAYELGDKKAIHQLARLYYSIGEYSKAVEYFTIGARNNDLDSIYHLGVCYAKGLGVKQDFVQARRFYEIGANSLEPRCLYNLSLYYRNGITVDQNIALANKLESQAYENGFKK